MPDEQDFDSFVPESQARRELGDVSSMQFWRFDHIPERAPPGWELPVKIGKRNYRSRRMLETVKANLMRAAQQRARERTPRADVT
jgi:hypothetical protein